MAWPVNEQISLGTLADEVVVSQTLLNLEQQAWISSADLTWALREFTAGEGPIQVGLAAGSLTVTEIKEGLEASPSSQSDVTANEQAKRRIRDAGSFNGSGAIEVLNDGKPIRSKIRWMAGMNAMDVDFWAKNRGGAALTTGAVIEVTGKVYGTWRN